MDIRNEALREHSKVNTLRIVDHILANPSTTNELISLFFNDTYRVTQRLAWVVGILAEKKPSLIKPYLPDMIKLFGDTTKHDAIRRNIVRTLQNIEIPENCESELYMYCMDALVNNEEAIAIRCFSMTVLYNIASKYPDLKNELKEVLLLLNEVESAGFKSRSRKIRHLLTKK